MNIQVFDISNKVDFIEINETQKNNIEKLFIELTEETHLITSCYLDTKTDNYKNSPIYSFKEATNKEKLDFEQVANDLLNAECKRDGTRNSTIQEGLLFIRSNGIRLTIMKLEKLEVIDKESYEIKSELGKEKNYFKICIFNGDYNNIKIIDKNRTAAKYWYEKFLGLSRKRTSEDNTQDVIDLNSNDRLYSEEVTQKENYKKIKKFTEYYLFDNKKFDKSNLFDELNSSGLIEMKSEKQLFSNKSIILDAEFTIEETIIKKYYKRKIQTSEDVAIVTNNYLESLRDNELSFNEKEKTITIVVDDEYIQKVKDSLKNE
ncbi:hypothetical protein [Dolosigranulum pigrum]|uniref:hypothetical protein n=1 Tax=Dolosigranulum pigrum TaxID=29394 RepID=UPI001AD8725A|nr:hypothetical protein [Dolosigranulum pigrum]QTJ56418.1 hypothetical protein FE335_02430 [Dolosigranulum pigrum]